MLVLVVLWNMMKIGSGDPGRYSVERKLAKYEDTTLGEILMWIAQYVRTILQTIRGMMTVNHTLFLESF